MPSRHRRSVRLRAHDYRGGLYFVTACTAGRRPLFGGVVSFEMALSAVGQIAHDEWVRTGEVRPDVVLDAFVVMPDHVHLLFGIAAPRATTVPPTGGRGVLQYAPTGEARTFGSPSRTVGAVIRGYKGAVTRAVRARGRGTDAVWQRGSYDRVVRTDREAEAVRRYVRENPARWHLRGDRRDGHRA